MIVLLGLILAVLASALFSGLETGLYTTSRLRLYLDAQAGVKAARAARRLLADMPTLLTVLLVANNLANWAASFLTQVALVRWDVRSPELVGTLVVSALLFVVAESAPKNAFRRAREGLLYPALPVLVGAHRLLRLPTLPVTWFARLLSRAVRRRLRAGSRPPGEREAMLRAGAEEGFLTAFQERVARGVLAMRSRQAGDEAQPLEQYPVARVGAPGLRRPAAGREHRVLVLDAGGRRVVGWLPAAALWEPGGFRAPSRQELRPVTHLDAATGLDRVYATLDRTGAPFAVVDGPGGSRVLDATRLRERVMGTFGNAPA